MGPALLLSVAMAAANSSMSSVVICTDGISNVGVGALTTQSSEVEHEYATVGVGFDM